MKYLLANLFWKVVKLRPTGQRTQTTFEVLLYEHDDTSTKTRTVLHMCYCEDVIMIRRVLQCHAHYIYICFFLYRKRDKYKYQNGKV